MNEQAPKELSKRTRMVILAVVLVLIAAMLVAKYTLPGATDSGSVPAQEKLDACLSNGTPVMVFFYSDSCRSCQEMEAVIAEVYPAFSESVVLIKVNVYDEEVLQLVDQTGVQITPTTLFIDRTGHKLLVPEKMSADELRSRLSILAGGQP